MTLTLPVDVELIVIDYLLDDPNIAALVSDRVYGELPAGVTLPAIIVRRIGGLASWPAGHLDRPRIQIESYGNTKKIAKTVSATARAVMKKIPGSYSGAVVTAADEDAGEIWLPDPVGTPGTPATPRYLFAAVLVVHPVA